MKLNILVVIVAGVAQFAILSHAQELDGSDIRKEIRERDEKVSRLSTDDQLRLRAAEQKAAQDPEVKAALEKRNKAIQEFRAAMRESMIKADPSLESILAKVAMPVKTRP